MESQKGARKPPLQPKAKSDTRAPRTPSGERPTVSTRSEELGFDVQMGGAPFGSTEVTDSCRSCAETRP
eukprot:468406-Pyramimonas_sp.AAC.1